MRPVVRLLLAPLLVSGYLLLGALITVCLTFWAICLWAVENRTDDARDMFHLVRDYWAPPMWWQFVKGT